MTLQLKDGVKIAGIRPELVFGLGICDRVYELFGVRICVVTSICDGPHGRNSLHNVGQAGDLRTRDLSDDKIAGIAIECRTRLGAEFDVVIEKNPDHLHIEFQPK